MTSLPSRFLLTGVIFVLIGMAWGIQMAATDDHMLSPAHAHLNLVGFVLMAVFAFYYALTPTAAATGVARAHYWLHLLAVLIMIPGIVMVITEQGDVLAKLGSVLTLLSMLAFGYLVLRHGLGRQRS